ncbi:unnamed protein product [Gongylonema pulchrum]|uniref:DH domain-containing protein n=1 Tax=Gongylonema pulchrum TaxID=637853 RepID=A0A183DU88_9BILA|nr:unnamed protein product [Gongylonema pulchrum]
MQQTFDVPRRTAEVKNFFQDSLKNVRDGMRWRYFVSVVGGAQQDDIRRDLRQFWSGSNKEIRVHGKIRERAAENVADAFQRFMDDETWRYEGEIGDAVIDSFLDGCCATTKLPSVLQSSEASNAKSDGAIEFAEQFQFIMRNSSPERLNLVIAWEKKMGDKMLSLIRARDFELDRMYRECEQAVSASASDNGQALPQSGQHLSRLNERIREVSKNYSDQIGALTSQHRIFYRNLIRNLYENDEVPVGAELALASHTLPVQRCLDLCGLSTSSAMLSLIRARDFELDRMYRECEQAVSVSASDNGQALPQSGQHLSRLNERIREVSKNYSDQIGALTSQHRIFYRNLIRNLYENDEVPVGAELALASHTLPVQRSSSTLSSSDSNKSPTKFSLDESFTIYLGAQLKTMHNARLLTCASLTDICNPSQLPEDDALTTRRLHMSLALYGRELSGLVLLVGGDPMYHINFARICERSTELHFESLEDQLKHLPLLVIFHLIGDKSLEKDEISSRHPCINGLRNAVQICANCGVTTFTIPLLLVEKSNEHMTANWCMKRAELVFKCVKGFMMEACSGSSTAGGGAPTATTHFNVNFALPQDLQSTIFTQILELFPSIFHLVPSVIM